MERGGKHRNDQPHHVCASGASGNVQVADGANREIGSMRFDDGPRSPSEPSVMVGAALALALSVYGIVAKRRAAARSAARGRSPECSSVRPRPDWRKIPGRVVRAILKNNLNFISAGVAFHAFLAIPATFAVLTSLALLTFDPEAVRRTIRPIEHMVPPYVLELLSEPHSLQTLGIGLLISLAVDFWSVLSGSSCLLTALRLVHGETGKGGFIDRSVSILRVAAIITPFVLLSLLLIVVLRTITDFVPLNQSVKATISIVRWPILAALFMSVLAAVYRHAPYRAERRWQWTSWGAVVATVLWIAGSVVFSVYATEFVAHDPTYGALAAILGLLAWLDFTALTVLLGAQIDVEIAREPRPG